ncbi:MAG: rhomboid family intramembrane serine protease [Mycolicibacterium neoaurum]|nr:rhomboid family intramembrane serine protease [Mycolicibacterium neoaurum]
MTYPPPQVPPQAAPVCYRHPGRQTYVQCTRCGRYICGDCMISAAVGHQCPECVAAGAATIRPTQGRFGGKVASDKPLVTYTLIAVNVVMFVLQMASGWVYNQFVLWPLAIAVDDQYYRLVTSAFLHGGIMHILFNMYALCVLGPSLERLLGRLRFGALYGLCALGGSVLVYLITPVNTATLGASGAVFGLFGAIFVVSRRLNLDVRWVVGLIALNVVFTFVAPLIGAGAISWQGHLGGLVTGALVAAGFVYAPKARRNLVQGAVAGTLLLLFVLLVWLRTEHLLTMFGGYLNLR